MIRRMLIAGFAALALSGPAHASTFTSYYALGDSLTYDGRLGPLPAPSLGGRLSNGPVYAEYIADLFTAAGLPSFNLALAGATAGDVNENDDQLPPAASAAFGTFARQAVTLASPGAALFSGDKPLVSALFGANDFFQRSDEPGFDPVALASKVVATIKTISELYNFDNFLVINLPDLSRIPSTRSLSDAERDLLRLAVQGFNFALDAELAFHAKVEDPTFNYEIYDLFGTFEDLLKNSDDLGLRLDAICTPSISNPDDFNICPTPESANGFFFVDGVHPSALPHQLIGRDIIAQTSGLPSVAAVPLPASMPLVLVGLAALGWLRRCRKASRWTPT